MIFLINKENFELKSSLDKALNRLLYEFQEEVSTLLEQSKVNLPIELSKLPGKITKGNNHKGFPFQVSDFPSSLSKQHIFSFRSVIWYAHHFSFSLILSGQERSEFPLDMKRLESKGYCLLLSETIWETDLLREPHLIINSQNLNEIEVLINKRDSLKLFKVFSLNHIDDFKRLGVECFKDFFGQS